MRVRTAHDVRVRLPRLVQVVGVAAFASKQYWIFGALNSFADFESHRQIIPEKARRSARQKRNALTRMVPARMVGRVPEVTCRHRRLCAGDPFSSPATQTKPRRPATFRCGGRGALPALGRDSKLNAIHKETQ